MRILLTGHMGFIGSELFKRLKNDGYTVYGYDIKTGQDICSSPFEYDVDLVIHLAGKSGVRESLKNIASYWHTNVEGSKRIFDVFKGTRIIYASSSSAYEPHLNPYAASKYLMECAAAKHNNALGLRLHTVYSDVPRAGMFLDKLMKGELSYVTPHRRDFIHLDDVCDAFKLIIESKLKGVIDVGTGLSVSVQDLAPELPVRLNTPHERKCTEAKIKELSNLGFEPKYTIQKFLTDKGIEHKI
jgi:nucleoside-diphosphate-sugar epimerase